MAVATAPEQFKDLLETFDYADSELVIGVVCAVGTDYGPIEACLGEALGRYGYSTRTVRISRFIEKLTAAELPTAPELERIGARMDAGNNLCRASGRKDIWALAATADINAQRETQRITDGLFIQKPLPRLAHILLSLKRPEEVATLRKIYRDGFFLVGVFATEKERLDHLINLNIAKDDAVALIKRDSEESDPYGQQTRATFYLSDVFVRLRQSAYVEELHRFFDLVFSNPFITPTQQEHAMFLAYASSLRSGQLGRQVGAAITTRLGDVLAVGCNDVPKPGGGLYWPGEGDRRDHVLGFDTNDRQRETIVNRAISRLPSAVEHGDEEKMRSALWDVMDISEFGRAVHAEMDALLTCARSGVSPVGGILYTTTFPCHNCTRHIIAAGIERVIYIEPYAKSRAEELHQDAIVVEEKASETGRRFPRKVPFSPFVGVGPRRYFDLFSLTLSRGYELIRKRDGKQIRVLQPGSLVRVPLSPFAYIQREAYAIKQLDLVPKQLEIFPEGGRHDAGKEQKH